jgi:GNAT superfamily N-acetyltransferase
MTANQGAFWVTIGEHTSVIQETFSDAKIAWTSSEEDIGYGYNSTFPQRIEAADFDAAITACLERTKKRGVRSEWWISPDAIHKGLGERLLSSGFAHARDMPGMAVDLSKLEMPSPGNVEIKLVDDEARFVDWVNTPVEGWPLPDNWREPFEQALPAYGLGADRDLRLYVGYVEGVPVAVSSVILSDGVAGIYTVATRAEHRGKGLGGLITLAPLLDARDEGYRVGILQASEMGKPVYLRLGFEDVFQYQVFVWPAPVG